LQQPDATPEKAATAVVNAAYVAGSGDNLTVMVTKMDDLLSA